jgi:hypothetical protein
MPCLFTKARASEGLIAALHLAFFDLALDSGEGPRLGVADWRIAGVRVEIALER